jgi:hypothetical protein
LSKFLVMNTTDKPAGVVIEPWADSVASVLTRTAPAMPATAEESRTAPYTIMQVLPQGDHFAFIEPRLLLKTIAEMLR